MTKFVEPDPHNKRDLRALRASPLLNASPAAIDAYIDANVTDLQSARDALKVLAKAIALVAKAHIAR